MPARTSALARAMFWREPRLPMWLVPTLVMTATLGRAARLMRVSSPAWFMPISTTRSWASSGAAKMVRGTPMRLLKLPAVACTRRPAPRPAASISLVVVLPTEPVTPTTVHCGLRRRHSPARRSMNSSPSSAWARITAAPLALATESSSCVGSAVRTTAAAPARTAAGAKSLPSTRSPGKATKSDPSPTLRESICTLVTTVWAGPATSVAPVAAATSPTAMRIIQSPLAA